jgi:hypothetical protein
MPRRALNASGELSEATFQGQVVSLANLYGWRIRHEPAGGKGGRVDREQVGRGFPDLVLLRPPRLIFAELKTASGRVSVAQQEWLDDLRRVGETIERESAHGDYHPGFDGGVEAYLWRPDDLQDIANLLAGNGIDPEIGRSFAAERSPGVRAVTPLVRPHRKGRA